MFQIAAVYRISLNDLLCIDCPMCFPNLVQFGTLIFENEMGESCMFHTGSVQ